MSQSGQQWEAELSALLAEADAGQWDTLGENAVALQSALEAAGDEGREFRELLIDGSAVLERAALALTSGRMDAASSLLGIGLDATLTLAARAVAALAARDLELIVALCEIMPLSTMSGEQAFQRALADLTVEALFAAPDRDMHLLALFTMAWRDRTGEDTQARDARVERARAVGIEYSDDAVRRTVVDVCRRRRAAKNDDAVVFEQCSASLGPSVLDQPHVFAECAVCAQRCIERGSHDRGPYETAILHALVHGRTSDAAALRDVLGARRKSRSIDRLWTRATEAVRDLRARRGPAGFMTPESDWTAEHERLWKGLVPRSGEAATVQGELIRCTGRLTDEWYRNGNGNFSDYHVAMIDFVERTLTSGCVFTTEEAEEIRRDAATVRSNATLLDDTLPLHDTCYYRLSACAVRWCRAHSVPMDRVTTS